MARRPGLLVAALLTLALCPTAAGAAVRAPAVKEPSVRVLKCDTEAQAATFRSTMRTIAGARQLQMRFTLQGRSVEEPAWAAIRGPGFDVWLSARRGRTGFQFDKTVEALPAPGDYRVLVRYRWRDAAGTTLARQKRTSKACAQPDPRPDLQPKALEPVKGGFVLTVVNAGAGAAPASSASLTAGATATPQPVPPLAPGAQAKVRFDRVTCVPQSSLVAVVDPDDAVEEADETGNVLTLACPSASS